MATVARALEELRQEGVISNIKKTAPFSLDDQKEIDFLIFPFWAGAIKLQVKVSYNKEKECKRRGIFL